MGDKPLVLIPALNEQATIQEVISSVIAQGFDVVVIDDGSGDSTSALARQAGATILKLRINLGVGGAMRCGFRYAVNNGYHSVVQCDADGQHPHFTYSRTYKCLRQDFGALSDWQSISEQRFDHECDVAPSICDVGSKFVCVASMSNQNHRFHFRFSLDF